MRAKELSLSDISIDSDIQQRSGGSNNAVIDEYREVWDAGESFPPVDVFDDGKQKWLAGGFHRVISARHSGRESIAARVHKGTRKDAIVFACGENDTHGCRRTNADKRKAVETLLGLFANRSNRWIAEKAAVSDPFVITVRGHVQTVSTSHNGQSGPPKRTTGRDGKTYPTKRKSASKPQESPVQLTEKEIRYVEVTRVCDYLTFPAGIHDGILLDHNRSFKRMAKLWSSQERTLVRNYLSEDIKLLSKWLKEMEGMK